MSSFLLFSRAKQVLEIGLQASYHPITNLSESQWKQDQVHIWDNFLLNYIPSH